MTPLIDPRTGIVTDLVDRPLPPDLPPGLRLYVARLSDTSPFCPWPVDLVATGCTWWDQDAAKAAALGEAVERYCGGLIPQGLVRASYDALTERGRQAVDPGELVLFSTGQYADPGFPFRPFTRDLPIRWAPGRDLLDGTPRLIPAALTYTTLGRGEAYGDEPLLCPVPYAGLAAGRDRRDAEQAALLELVERDAVTVAWLSGDPIAQVEVPAPYASLFAGPAANLETTLYAFPNPVGLPVIGAMVRHRETGRLAMGTACRFDAGQAILKAVAEAVQLHLMLGQLADPDSPLMRQASSVSGSPLRPWRPDGRYATSYPAGNRDLRDLACHLQYYLDPSVHPPLLQRLASGPRTSLEETGRDAPANLEELLRRLAGRGMRPTSVDLTTSDVACTGWCAVRVCVPGLYANTPAAFPPLGGDRLDLSRVADLPPLPYA